MCPNRCKACEDSSCSACRSTHWQRAKYAANARCKRVTTFPGLYALVWYTNVIYTKTLNGIFTFFSRLSALADLPRPKSRTNSPVWRRLRQTHRGRADRLSAEMSPKTPPPLPHLPGQHRATSCNHFNYTTGQCLSYKSCILYICLN